MINDPSGIPNIEEQIELAPDTGTTPVLDDPTASARAFRAQYGLDEILKRSYDEIFTGLKSGEEDAMRTEAAAELSIRKSMAAENAIKTMAANKKGPLVTEEIQGLTKIIQDMQKEVDPTTVFEEAYGKKYLSVLDEIAKRNPDVIWNDAVRADPNGTAVLTNVGSTVAAKRGLIRTQRENNRAVLEEQGWPGYLLDLAKFLIPGYEESGSRGNVYVPGAPEPLGRALESQRKALMDMDWDSGEFQTKIKDIYEGLSGNPQLREEFFKSMEGLDPEEQFQKSAGIVFDLLGIPFVKGIKKIFRQPPDIKEGIVTSDFMTGKIKKVEPFEETFEQVRERHINAAVEQTRTMGMANFDDILKESAEKAVRDVVKAADAPQPTVATILESAGDVGEAAVQDATTKVVKYNKGIVDPLEEAESSLFSAWKGIETKLNTNVGSASRELIERIVNDWSGVRTRLLDAVKETQRIERLPEVLASEANVRQIKQMVKDMYPGLRNTILDIPRFYDETISNTRYAEVHMGQPSGELFSSPLTANAFRYVHGLKDFTIESKGTMYYLKGYRPVEETSDTIRDLIAKSEGTKTPMNNWFSGFGLHVRTPEETTSLAQRNNAKIATSVPAIAQEILQDSYKPIKALRGWFGYNSSKKWTDLRDVMKAAQDIEVDGVRGKFFDTVGDFEDFFMKSKSFRPDEQQIEAYFSFTRGMEMDRIFRNIAEHKFMVREGAETHRFYADGPGGSRVFSPEVVGVARNKMAGGTDVVAIINKNTGKERIVNIATMSKKEWDEFDTNIKAGLTKMVELWNPELRPLDGFGRITNERIRYVISEGTETSRLKWDHVPRRGGGHVEYDYQYFIKQPSVIDEVVGNTKRKWYEGDTTIMPIAVRAMGKEVADHLDKVRVLLKNKDVDGARDYARKHMHIEWDTIHGWFKTKHAPDGKLIPARLNLDETIKVVEKNRSIMKTDNDLLNKYKTRASEDPDFEFRDGTTEGSLARQYQVAYTEERDAEKLFTVHSGDEGPLYKIADVETVDPISTMNRALNRISKSNYLDDYKIASVEHWLSEAARYMKLDDPNQVRYAPWKYFNQEDNWLAGTDPKTKAALENSRAAINALIGKPSSIDVWLDTATASAVDTIYKRAGESAAMYSQKVLMNTSNPFTFMRGVVFHAKLGLYNVSQFLAQSMTYTNVWGIAGPKYAATSTYAAQLHFWSTLNGRKAILDHLDSMATKLQIPGASNWKPGQLKESIQEGEKTGFFNVNNYALDNPFSNRLVSTVFGDILESGTMFFKGGERNSKTVAWHTAYKEWRDANPHKKIDNTERAKILERADLLNNNMTKASNSVLHTGVLSVPSQFYTYQLRMSELMWGKRLTTTERIRLAGINMLAYGVPVGAGVSGLPFADMELPYIGGLREWAKENNYIVGQKFWETLAMEGLPSYLITMATGKQYNVGDRLGAKGLDTINSVLRGDDVMWKTIGGAAGGVFKSTWDRLDPFWAWAKGMMGSNEHFPISGSDYLNILKEISIVNSGDALYATLNTGRQLSKKGDFINNADVTDGFVKFFTGIQSQDSADSMRVSKALGKQDEKWKRAIQWAQREVRDGMRAQANNNQPQADRYYTRAKTILSEYDVPFRERTKALSRGVQEEKSLVDKLTYDWYIRKAPPSKASQRFDDLRQRQEFERNKGN